MTYENPQRPCDLVLKGGTTSGVLYPSAVCRFAQDFEFIGVGGTSAGALASAAAAAAEFRRRNGSADGYEQLATLPDELAEPGRLRSLFTPEKSTRKLFQLIDNWQQSGDAPIARLAWLGLTRRLKKWERAWNQNGMGCCTGMALDGMPKKSKAEWRPITPWLSSYLDQLAGLDEARRPLTFGDLWDAPQPKSLDGTGIHLERSIDARFVATSLTFARPVEIPFTSKIFGFRPAQWRRLFPEYVVQHLERHARETEIFDRFEDIVPLPPPEELPVVVAARMSMSLPGIFTAVPLEAIDYEQEAGDLPRTVWFSDGGITSNLPIHRFDAVLPRWPTLAINLQYAKRNSHPAKARKDVTDDNLYLPTRRNEGSNPLWLGVSEQTPKKTFSGVAGFLGSILSSALRWHDNSYLVLPGYKGRVVEIWLEPHEGGNNWDMDQKVVIRLKERGAKAADLLTRRILETPDAEAFSWNDQRWRRFRTVMAGMAEWLGPFDGAADFDGHGAQRLDDLLANPPHHNLDSAAVETGLKALRTLSAEAAKDVWLDKKRPKPSVEIGTRPPITMAAAETE